MKLMPKYADNSLCIYECLNTDNVVKSIAIVHKLYKDQLTKKKRLYLEVPLMIPNHWGISAFKHCRKELENIELKYQQDDYVAFYKPNYLVTLSTIVNTTCSDLNKAFLHVCKT